MSRISISLMCAAAFFTAASNHAQAALVTTLTGVAGEGRSTVTFSGSTTPTGNGTIRPFASVGSSIEDTWQPGGDQIDLVNPIPNWLNSSSFLLPVEFVLPVELDATAALASTRHIPFGFTFLKVPIVGIFFGDRPSGLEQTDQFGIRTEIAVEYEVGDEISLSGSAGIPIDFGAFIPGTYVSDPTASFGFFPVGPTFAGEEVTLVIEASQPVHTTPIPLPASLPFLLTGIV